MSKINREKLSFSPEKLNQPNGKFMAALPISGTNKSLILRRTTSDEEVPYNTSIEPSFPIATINNILQIPELPIRDTVPIDCIPMKIGDMREFVDIRNPTTNIDGVWVDLNGNNQFEQDFDLFIPEHRLLYALYNSVVVSPPNGNEDIALAYVRGIKKDHLLVFEDDEFGGDKLYQDYLRDTIATLTSFDNNSEKRGESTKGYRDEVHGYGGIKQLFRPERLSEMPLPELREVARQMLKRAVKFEDIIQAEVRLSDMAGEELIDNPFLNDYLFKDSKIDDLIAMVDHKIDQVRHQISETKNAIADKYERMMPDESVVPRIQFALNTGNAIILGGMLASGLAVGPIGVGGLIGATSLTLLQSLIKLRNELKEKKALLARKNLEQIRRELRSRPDWLVPNKSYRQESSQSILNLANRQIDNNPEYMSYRQG